MDDNQNKNIPNQEYSMGKEPILFFINSLQENQKYLQSNSENWAEKLTYDVQKQIIQFDFLFVAFIATMQQEFNNRIWLYTAVLFAVVSIIVAFWCIWLACYENINSLNKRNDVVEKNLNDIKNGQHPLSLLPNYNIEISYLMGELRGRERFFRLTQKVAIFFFLCSLVIGIVGILI